MARTSTFATVGKHKIELSNLKKVLFPSDSIVKAELIEYYLKIAPTILQHIKRRPLTLVRWPDGVDHQTFFQKNRPDWAPAWLEHIKLGNDDKPDYIVWDLDPPEGYPFADVVSLAFDIKQHIEKFGYHTFVKTTGGKGVHVVAPIEPKWPFDVARDATLQIAKSFVEANSTTTTLHIKKDLRKGRVLIDIYRNSTYQTIVSPYSVRGRGNAPVS